MIKKTYIPAKPRNKKLIGTGGGGGISSSMSGAVANSHTHANKAVLDLFRLDENGNVYLNEGFYSKGNVSAFGAGESEGGGGGSMNMMQDWTIPTGTENYYLPAQLAVPFYKDTRDRLTVLEAGTAPAPEDQVSNWLTTDVNSFSYIKNKPTKLSEFSNDLGNYGSWITKAQGDGYYAPKSHTHSYLPLSGGTLTGNVTAPTFIGALSGNATTATTLATARTLTVGNKGKTFNGSVDVSWSLTEIGAASLSQSVLAGKGLTGGGTLADDRTITLGKPSTLTASTTNEVTANSHTHAITTTSVGAANTIIQTDARGGTKLGILTIGDWSLLTEASGKDFTIKYGDANKMSISTVYGSGVVNFFSDLFIQDDITAGGIFSENYVKAYDLIAYETVTTPKVIFAAAGWSMIQVGSELQMQFNGVVKQRYTSTGDVIATGEISAHQ